MVFEGILVDVLNILLRDYFENLDTSQLRLGLWGGDLVLRELVLKQSVITDLGLPFKVVVGKVGTLKVKIPWSSLYTAPVEINLKNLVLLITPSCSIKYDEEAEEKAMQAEKQSQLVRLDEIRKRQKLKQNTDLNNRQDTFVEKLVTQIIKNIQIHIDCIHIRYEDDVTKPTSPFGCGVIFKDLRIETTNDQWVPSVITVTVETNETVNKLAALHGFSVYWNSKTELIQRLSSKKEMIKLMGEMVLEESEKSKLTNILGPIEAVAKVLLTPNPERSKTPFAKPKLWIDLDLEELSLGLTNLQFQDIMPFLDVIDYMIKAQYYRKYRPYGLTYKGHYKEWWHFAYNCILEEQVRRRRRNWNWERIAIVSFVKLIQRPTIRN